MTASLQGMTEIEVVSTLDGSPEKNLFWLPSGKKGVPLLVGLHTWSANRFNQVDHLLPFCEQRSWALVLPEFRGANKPDNPRARQACASRLARQDVLDAVEKIAADYPIDVQRIFLAGGSGGGHMALMMAAETPAVWRAVSSWCPITDLASWHGQNPGYRAGIEACTGGKPGESDAVDAEYTERSPMTHAAKIARATLSLHHGRFDNSVPYSHSMKLAVKLEELGAERFFFQLFDGGHEMRYAEAFRWFDSLIARDAGRPEELTG